MSDLWHGLTNPERRQLGRRLTDKQLLVYTMRRKGESWEDIAWALTLSIRTVRNHYTAAEIKHEQIKAELARKDAA